MIEIRVTSLVRVAGGEDGAGWRRALEGREWVGSAVVMKSDGGNWVRRARVMGREVVVKCRELGTWWKRVKFGVGMGHGAKQWRGAERLMKAGIATGRPLVVARAVVDGRVCEVMVLEFVEGKTLLEVLDEVKRGVGLGVREQHAVARAVGEQLDLLEVKGLRNRDHKPSNLVVVFSGMGVPQIAILDCVSVSGGGIFSKLPSHRMLASLAIEPCGCELLPRRGLLARVVDAYVRANLEDVQRHIWPEVRKSVKRMVWDDVAAAVKSHGDPRPRVDPFGGGGESGRGGVSPLRGSGESGPLAVGLRPRQGTDAPPGQETKAE